MHELWCWKERELERRSAFSVQGILSFLASERLFEFLMIMTIDGAGVAWSGVE